jgi:hypothetical protein
MAEFTASVRATFQKIGADIKAIKTGYVQKTAFDPRNCTPQLMMTFDRIGLQSVMQHAVTIVSTGQYLVSQAQPSNLPNAEHTIVSLMSPQGVLLSWMRLMNAGHGTTIDYEYISGELWIWCCFNTVDATTGTTTVSDIAKVKYRGVVGGVDVYKTDANVVVVNKFTTAYSLPGIDRENDWIVFRTSASGAETFTRRKWSELKAGINVTYGVLGPFMNSVDGSTNGHVPQGFTSYGDVLYRYTGETSDGTDPMMITAFSWTTQSSTPLYLLPVASLPVEPSGRYIGPDRTYSGDTTGTAAVGFAEPEGVYAYKSTAGKVILTCGFSVSHGLARQYQVFGFVQDESAAGSKLTQGFDFLLPTLRDTTGRMPGDGKALKQFDRFGWYYLSSTEFASMLDKPDDALPGGYYLQNSARDAGGTSGIQMLIRNTTAASGPDTYVRAINWTSGAAGPWSYVGGIVQFNCLGGTNATYNANFDQMDNGTGAITYKKSGRVHTLAGTLKLTAASFSLPTSNTTAFTITNPMYVPPSVNTTVYSTAVSGGGLIRINVLTTGVVYISSSTGSAISMTSANPYIPFSLTWIA